MKYLPQVLVALAAILGLPPLNAAATTHYVDANSTNATPPYTDWSTAATNIQDAVDAAAAGDEVVVTNGIYAAGGRSVGFTGNRVVVEKPLNVRSVSGAQSTTIDGVGLARCAWLTNGASLTGFTLTGGYAGDGVGGGAYGGTLNVCTLTENGYDFNGGYSASQGGGAAHCTLINCTLSGNTAADPGNGVGALGGGAYDCTLINCTLTGNVASSELFYDSGGGAAKSTLINCTLTGNISSRGGGASNCTLTNCTFGGNYSYGSGGGAYDCTLNNCTLTGNSNSTLSGSYDSGGGAYGGTLSYCTLSSNSAHIYGGGVAGATLNNCTLTGNFAAYGGGAYGSELINCTVAGNSAGYGGGGGVYNCGLNNCIVYFNTNYVSANYAGGGLSYCCTTPQPTNGLGNITNAPVFVDINGWANLRLQSNSPCINAGNNSYFFYHPASFDLDGNPRIVSGTVDIGAYEYQAPASMISYAWLQQYGLPINTSTDAADPDGDGVDNYHEWLAGTDPTNRFSSPAQLTIVPSGTNILVTWPTNAVGFTLQSATDLTSTALWSTNLPAPVVVGGQLTVTNPITGPQQYYRLIH
jgi:hypothetical protein